MSRLAVPARRSLAYLGGLLGRLAQPTGWLALATAGLLLCAYVSWSLWNSDYFALQSIRVMGSDRLSREEVLSWAGMDLGDNIFSHAPSEVRARLLEHPWIREADVERKIPRSLLIELKEERPVAQIVADTCEPSAGPGDGRPIRSGTEPDALLPGPPGPCVNGRLGNLYLVSEEARIIKRLGGEDPSDLPVVTGVSWQRLVRDRPFKEGLLTSIVALMQDFRDAGLWRARPIQEIHVDEESRLSVYLGDDLTYIRLGFPPFNEKLRRLRKVFTRLERMHAEARYVYLDNEVHPERVVLRLR